MGIGSKETSMQEAALRPNLRGLQKHSSGTHSNPPRTTTWSAKRSKRTGDSLKNPPLPSTSFKEEKEGGTIRRLGGGAAKLVLFAAGLTICVGGGYVLSQELKGAGVDVNAERTQESTNNSYFPVSEGANIVIPPSIAPAVAEPQPVPVQTQAPIPTTIPVVVEAPPTVELPNPLTFSANAGNVVCSGDVVVVPITADSRQFAALQDATGEPWAAGNPPHDDDNALFLEVLAYNGFTNGTPPAPPYELAVRTGCVGLEQ